MGRRERALEVLAPAVTQEGKKEELGGGPRCVRVVAESKCKESSHKKCNIEWLINLLYKGTA